MTLAPKMLIDVAKNDGNKQDENNRGNNNALFFFLSKLLISLFVLIAFSGCLVIPIPPTGNDAGKYGFVDISITYYPNVQYLPRPQYMPK